MEHVPHRQRVARALALLEQQYSEQEQRAYLRLRWAETLIRAYRHQRRSRNRYVVARMLPIAGGTLLPVLVAGQMRGPDGIQHDVLSGLAIGISLLVALSTGLIEITKLDYRWRLYQRLRYDLEHLGWFLSQRRGPYAQVQNSNEAFSRFIEDVEEVIERFNSNYLAHIATVEPARSQSSAHIDPSEHASYQVKL